MNKRHTHRKNYENIKYVYVCIWMCNGVGWTEKRNEMEWNASGHSRNNFGEPKKWKKERKRKLNVNETKEYSFIQTNHVCNKIHMDLLFCIAGMILHQRSPDIFVQFQVITSIVMCSKRKGNWIWMNIFRNQKDCITLFNNSNSHKNNHNGIILSHFSYLQKCRHEYRRNDDDVHSNHEKNNSVSYPFLVLLFSM